MDKKSGPEPLKKLPPFYKALKKYAEQKKFLWSTPGHSGGTGLEATRLGRDFKNFFGPNIFEADTSNSVVEMGSLLQHQGPAAAAEKNAADIFGADITFFVLNGTSTANKVVFFSTVAQNDVVLVGRNCHKSIMHSIIMNDAIPVYLKPKVNCYGIIGPVSQSEFDWKNIKEKINNSPLITNKKARKVQLTSITNSTYDGFLYNADKVSSLMAGNTHFLHFDEAWFPYGAFHPFYDKRYAMSPYRKRRGVHMPPVFSTQSTHKLLFSFSQSSMLHFRQGTGKKEMDIQGLIEANLMHASTSPFYPLFASLDVSAEIMKESGYRLINEALQEAMRFRNVMANKYRKYSARGDWWFKVFQPQHKNLRASAEEWTLKKDNPWHGFDLEDGEDIFMDPLKITLLTPGIKENDTWEDIGIPSVVVAKFLRSRGIVPEKAGFYNILFLFAPGSSRKKVVRLERALSEFKTLHDENAPIFEVFPDLLKDYKECYPPQAGLRDLCLQMHLFLQRHDIVTAASQMFTQFPEQALAPYRAYYSLVEGRTEYLPLDEISGRISAFMVLPYPPGIPIIMPGEIFPEQGSVMLRFLKMNELFDNIFRGFETEFHGIKKIWQGGRPVYMINCLKKNAKNKKPRVS